ADTPETIAVYEEVRAGIKDAIARGLAPNVDADFLTSACIGIAQDLGQIMLRRNPVNVDAAVDFCAAFILGGVAAAPRKE
ncbi:MAG: TetR/AcrR family transcriptional regulator, partial [Hyphomonadaceae bacterium]